MSSEGLTLRMGDQAVTGFDFYSPPKLINSKSTPFVVLGENYVKTSEGSSKIYLVMDTRSGEKFTLPEAVYFTLFG